jgi:hypothetical protein
MIKRSHVRSRNIIQIQNPPSANSANLKRSHSSLYFLKMHHIGSHGCAALHSFSWLLENEIYKALLHDFALFPLVSSQHVFQKRTSTSAHVLCEMWYGPRHKSLLFFLIFSLLTQPLPPSTPNLFASVMSHLGSEMPAECCTILKTKISQAYVIRRSLAWTCIPLPSRISYLHT